MVNEIRRRCLKHQWEKRSMDINYRKLCILDRMQASGALALRANPMGTFWIENFHRDSDTAMRT